MDSKANKRIILGLILSCWLTYTFSISMKMAYSASMAAIKEEYLISNTAASLPLTLYYVFYAVIQFALALFITKINVKAYMAVNFVISGLSYISVLFFSPIWYLDVVLAINGITLGAVWCGAVLVFSKYMSQKTMDGALLFMSAGFAVGGALSFGVGALAIHLNNWRISFLVFGLAFLFSTFYELSAISRAERAQLSPKEEDVPLKKQTYKADGISAKPLFIMSTVAVFFASFLYYGFNNWMPKILFDIFGLTNAKATLITTLFPIVVYFGSILSVFICNKIQNDFLVSFIFSLVVAVIGFILAYLYDINVVLTVAIILVLGIFLRFLCNLFAVLTPLHIREHINSGKTSATINASASVSAAISPTVIALVLDASGGEWRTGFLILFAVAVLTLTVCLTFYVMNLIKKRQG